MWTESDLTPIDIHCFTRFKSEPKDRRGLRGLDGFSIFFFYYNKILGFINNCSFSANKTALAAFYYFYRQPYESRIENVLLCNHAAKSIKKNKLKRCIVFLGGNRCI